MATYHDPYSTCACPLGVRCPEGEALWQQMMAALNRAIETGADEDWRAYAEADLAWRLHFCDPLPEYQERVRRMWAEVWAEVLAQEVDHGQATRHTAL